MTQPEFDSANFSLPHNFSLEEFLAKAHEVGMDISLSTDSDGIRCNSSLSIHETGYELPDCHEAYGSNVWHALAGSLLHIIENFVVCTKEEHGD